MLVGKAGQYRQKDEYKDGGAAGLVLLLVFVLFAVF
jgi:hypothetical protein